MEVQTIAAQVASSEQAVEMAFGVFERGIQHSRSHQSAPLAIAEQEASIRALELAQRETLNAVSKFEFHKTSIEFAVPAAPPASHRLGFVHSSPLPTLEPLRATGTTWRLTTISSFSLLNRS
jgi:hypothetical protein